MMYVEFKVLLQGYTLNSSVLPSVDIKLLMIVNYYKSNKTILSNLASQ